MSSGDGGVIKGDFGFISSGGNVALLLAWGISGVMSASNGVKGKLGFGASVGKANLGFIPGRASANGGVADGKLGFNTPVGKVN